MMPTRLNTSPLVILSSDSGLHSTFLLLTSDDSDLFLGLMHLSWAWSVKRFKANIFYSDYGTLQHLFVTNGDSGQPRTTTLV